MTSVFDEDYQKVTNDLMTMLETSTDLGEKVFIARNGPLGCEAWLIFDESDAKKIFHFAVGDLNPTGIRKLADELLKVADANEILERNDPKEIDDYYEQSTGQAAPNKRWH